MGSKKRKSPPKVPKDRQEQKEATREALIRAGLAELTERGVEGSSLDAICARAGFTRGAFYVHFRDRDDLLVAVMDHVLGEFLSLISATSLEGGGVAEAARFFAVAADGRSAAVHGGRGIRFDNLMEACRRSKPIGDRYRGMVALARERIAQGVARDQEKKKIRRDVAPERVTTLLTAIALGVSAMIELDLPFAATDVAETMLSLLGPKIGRTVAARPAS
jgi:AcrR family transcriptional regulator